MTRLQAKDFLISLGIAEPTEEAITNYLNNMNGEIQKERIKAEAYKKDSEKVAELQAQLDAINQQNMTDIEKAQNDTKIANDRIAQLEAQIKEANIRKGLTDKGITGEDADKFVKALMEGTFDAESFGAIYEAGQKNAVANFEKEALKNTPNPKGGQEPPETKTDADKLAEAYTKSLGDTSKSSADIVNAYI